jgi:predicted HicB family RNase H-like nuclease
MPKNTQARINANNRYDKKTYSKLGFRVKKEQEPIIRAYIKSKGLSVNAYINRLIAQDMGELLESSNGDK